MGVPGLWELLRPAAARTSLSTLAKEGFMANSRGLRAYTIGIDASLWIFHAQLPQHGENPFLRTIFFKITTLLQQPVLPVFVFDGPDKPRMKRGARVAGKFGTHDRRSVEFKRLLDECGLAYWNAPGEAEAELALMNRQGKIDAVLSDDGDALLFGAKCLIRNNSATLSGTKASQHVSTTKGDMKTYEVFRSDAICAAWTSEEGTGLRTEEHCHLAMVWIALLAGGDYVPEGIETFGYKIAFGLAKAGLSADLSTYITDKTRFLSDLPSLQQRMIHELRTNSTGQIGRKNPARANALSSLAAEELINLDALESYMLPRTSGEDASKGWPGFSSTTVCGGSGRAGGRGNMEGLARACERFFEWGTRDLVVKRFVSESVGTFGSEIVQAARRTVLNRDDAGRPTFGGSGPGGAMTSSVTVSAPPASSSQQTSIAARRLSAGGEASYPEYIVKIERTRPDPTNKELTEYRLRYHTEPFVTRVHEAMEGSRVDPKHLTAKERATLGLVTPGQEPEDEQGEAKEDKDTGLARLWIADWLVRDAWPGLVVQWEEAEAGKSRSKSKGGHSRTASASSAKSGAASTRGKKGLRADGEDPHGFAAFFGSQAPVSAGTGTQARSFRRTISAPTGSSTMRSFGSAAATSKFSFNLAPVAESSRSSSPLKSATSANEEQRGEVTPPGRLGTASRTFGRTTSFPVRSLAAATMAAPRQAAVDWSFKEAMFIDSDEEAEFVVAPVGINDSTSHGGNPGSPKKRASPAAGSDSDLTPGPLSRSPGAAREPSLEVPRTAPSAKPFAKSTAVEVIDLCASSDSETEEQELIESRPPARRAPSKAGFAKAITVLRTSSRENSQPPIPAARGKPGLGASKPAVEAKSTRQTAIDPRQATLSFPITAPVSSSTSKASSPALKHSGVKQAARLAATPTPTKIKPKKGRKSYIVQEEDSDIEVIDSTRGGVNLQGYGYNV